MLMIFERLTQIGRRLRHGFSSLAHVRRRCLEFNGGGDAIWISADRRVRNGIEIWRKKRTQAYHNSVSSLVTLSV